MTALPKRYFTPEEYLELELKAEYKSQYVAGEIFAMAGAQPWHIEVTGNIFAGLHSRLRGRACHVYFASLSLANLECELPLAEIYERVSFPDPSVSGYAAGDR